MQQAVTSTHFHERARHYRFAAAVTDNKHDVEMFCDLSTMFETIARAFQRIEENRQLRQPASLTSSSSYLLPATLRTGARQYVRRLILS
jgi:hypothetical protein